MTRGATRSLKPRKSPRQRRSEQVVVFLLEAGAQILERDGLEGFTTNAVAERAGVSVGSLYQYFPNKAALLLALMRREGESFDAAAERSLDEATGNLGLAVFVRAAVEQQLLRPELARLLDVQQTVSDLKAEVGNPNVLISLILALLGRPDLPRQPSIDVAAQDVLAIVRGLTDTAGQQDERDVPNLERRISAAVFGYLREMNQTDRTSD